MPTNKLGTRYKTVRAIQATGTFRQTMITAVSAIAASARCGTAYLWPLLTKSMTLTSGQPDFAVQKARRSPVSIQQYRHQPAETKMPGRHTVHCLRRSDRSAMSSAMMTTNPFGRARTATDATSPASTSSDSSMNTNAQTDAARNSAEGYTTEKTNAPGNKEHVHTASRPTRAE